MAWPTHGEIARELRELLRNLDRAGEVARLSAKRSAITNEINKAIDRARRLIVRIESAT